jgi:capsular polysaccharide biosynthesis protein
MLTRDLDPLPLVKAMNSGVVPRLPDGVHLRWSSPSMRLPLANLVGTVVSPDVSDPEREHEIRGATVGTNMAPAAYLLEIEDGWLHVPSSVVAGRTHWIRESTRSVGLMPRRGLDFDIDPVNGHRLTLAETNRFPRPAVVLCGQNDFNYFHWWVENIGRLAHGMDGAPSDLDIVTHRLQRWQLDCLAAAGIDLARVHQLDQGVWSFPKLWFPSRGLAGAQEVSPFAVAMLERLAPIDALREHERLYLSRADARVRRVTNEQEVADLLAARGFRPVTLGDLSVREQIETLAHASAVVAVHGAGMVNLAFAPHGTPVLELAPQEQVPWAGELFRNLTAIKQQPYSVLVCPTRKGQVGSAIAQNEDLVVSPQLLQGSVDQMLAFQVTG